MLATRDWMATFAPCPATAAVESDAKASDNVIYLWAKDVPAPPVASEPVSLWSAVIGWALVVAFLPLWALAYVAAAD